MLKLVSRDQVILMPTTNSAYGQGQQDNFCDENSPLDPLSSYAKGKVEVETALMQFENATSFRLATAFGMSSRMRTDLLVNNFVYRAMIDGFLVLFESHFKRNYIHVSDVVSAFHHALNNPREFRGEVFNIGLSSANVSKFQLCELIQKTVAPKFVFMESDYGSDPDRRNYIVSNQKIERLGFSPKISLEEGIRELWHGLPMFIRTPFTNL